jgi:hypothetical protein
MATPDVSAPSFGGATSATPALGAIALNWNAASDDRSAATSLVYQIFQASAAMGENYATPTLTTAPGATTHKVTGLTANTKYYFVVRAKDEAGNVDKNTTEVSATTPAPDTTPPTFGGVTSAAVAGNSITLSWTAATDNASLPANLIYKIYQASTMGGENYTTPSYTTTAGATSFQIFNLTPGTNYFFVVRAQAESGNTSTNVQERSGVAVTPIFAANVQPLLTANCTSGCHSGMFPSDGLDLSAGKSYGNIVNVASGGCPTVKRVVPSQAANSYVVHKLNGTSTGCFSGGRMPVGGALTPAQMITVTGWINAGALNN